MITQSAQSHPVDVSVVTVGMNHLPYLKTLLASLFHTQASPLSFEMIYVDNCSHDGSVDFLQQHYPAVRIIRNSTVKGFGENNNIGAQYACGKYIAIINPDIEMINNSLHKLYSFAEQLPYQAILVPRLLNPDGSHQPSARQFMTLRIFLTRFFGRGNDKMAGKITQNYLCKQMDVEKKQFINWAIGASLFMPLNLYKQLNGFDTHYFLYAEDMDMCLRSWKMGHPIIYYPQAEMTHNHLRDSTKLNKRTLMHLKSIITFFRKHGLFVKSPIRKTSLVLPS